MDDREALFRASLAGVAGVAGSYAIAGRTPAFVAAPIDGALTRSMPGVVVAFAIETLGSLGQQLNFALALAIAAGFLGAAGLAGIRTGRAGAGSIGAVLAAAGLAWVVVAALTGRPLVAVGAALPVGAVVGVGEASPGEGGVAGGRRRVLASIGSVAGFGVLAYLAGRRAGWKRAETDPAAERGEIEALLAEAEEKSLDVAGIEPLVSEEFYNVDINSVDPTVSADEWELSVTGAVEEPVTIDYEALTTMEAQHRFVTLRCVGERLNGRKMDNALWTGTPVAPIIERARPTSGCECVMLRAVDDYYEEFPLAALRRGFLAWGMNGDALPRSHGHPVRALIPGHWGEINVKWLTEIEFLEKEAEGYWEKRGWHGTGPVNTVAKLHAINRLDGGRWQVGGHAYAGTRGIDRVEISVDDGPWREATLSEPLPGEDVWRQWKHEYDGPGEIHRVVVRAVDGDGDVQPEERSEAFPSGPTGWVKEWVGR